MDMLGYILFAFAAVVAVVLFTLRKQDASRADALAAKTAELEKDLAALKSDTSGRKDTLESRTKELTELKEKLRDTKKRLHEEKETHRKQEIEHAKAEAERAAQAQVEAARREAAELQLEVTRLKAELDTARTKKAPRVEAKPEPKAEAKPAVEVAVDLTAAAEPAKPRELTKVEQDRISLLERQAVKQAERVKQLEEEGKRYQRRADSNDKAYRVQKSELELARSKMTGVEKRLNKALLEMDKLRQVAFKAGLVKEIATAQAEAEKESAEKEQKNEVVAPPAAEVKPNAPEAKA